MVVNTRNLIRDIQRNFEEETFVYVEDENGEEFIIECIKPKSHAPNSVSCVLKCRKTEK